MTDPARRIAFLLAIVIVIGPTARADEPDSLARQVPADVGIYAEVTGATDLLTSLTEPQLWTTLADLAGQPSRLEDAAAWRLRIRRAIKMSPDEAIRTLFARGVAFVGEGVGRAQDAVVLCRPEAKTAIPELLKRWEARDVSRAGLPGTHQLFQNLGISVDRDVLVFGDLLPPKGMFRKVRAFQTGGDGPALAADPTYQRLLARVPADPDGVFFARLAAAAPVFVQPPASVTAQPASQPAAAPGDDPAPAPNATGVRAATIAQLPGPFQGAANILVSLHRDGPRLHFTAVGDGNGRQPASDDRPTPAPLLHHLPAETLAAWQGRVDYDSIDQLVAHLPERNILRMAMRMPEQIAAWRALIEQLEPDICINLGPVRVGNGYPPLPALGIVLAAKDADSAAYALRNLADLGVAGYAVAALAHGWTPLAPVTETDHPTRVIHVLDLRPVLRGVGEPAASDARLCWVDDGDALLVATHLDWLQRMLDARRTDTAQPRATTANRPQGTPRPSSKTRSCSRPDRSPTSVRSGSNTSKEPGPKCSPSAGGALANPAGTRSSSA